MNQALSVGSRVKISAAMLAPQWCMWDDDRGRSSTSTKSQLRQKFFNGDNRLTVEVAYVARESERDELRKAGRTKVRVREPSGAVIVIPVELATLTRA